MSNYAKIENNIVTNIIICDDEIISNVNGNYIKITNETNECHIGYEYISNKNKFKSPQPFNSWILNEETLAWEAPKEKPTDGFYRWDENTQEWIKVS